MFRLKLSTSSNFLLLLASTICSLTRKVCSSKTISCSRRVFSSASSADTALLLLACEAVSMSLNLIAARAPLGLPLGLFAGDPVPFALACFSTWGRDLRGSMWICKKLVACWKIAFWSFCCVGDCVGRSRKRRAAELYCVNESVSRLRTLEASASCAGVGGLSGSLKNAVNRRYRHGVGWAYCKATMSR